MERFTLEHDLPVVCVRAASFPGGVHAAFEKLHALFPADTRRRAYGISHRDGRGNIIYHAAATQLHDDEAGRYGLDEAFIIRRGTYVGETITDYMQNLPAIGRTFERLLAVPELDPAGYCLEEYFSEREMRCSVPVLDQPGRD